MVVLAVTWMAKIGRESEVAAIFEKLSAESRKEPGCLMYQVHKHKTDPRRFFIYEQYKDDAALEAHRAAPHFLPVGKKGSAQTRRPDRGAFVRAAGIGIAVAGISCQLSEKRRWPTGSSAETT